jgi:LemA protein
MKTFGLIMGGVVLFIVLIGLFVGTWFWGSYNSMVVTSTQVDTSWASVQTEYQRRFDLIPNLVAATQGTMTQEQDVFGAIAKARTQYAGAAASGNQTAQVQATQGYDSAIGRLLVVMENYPVLQSNTTVLSLMAELSGTENRVQVSRDRYNQSVQTYNIMLKSFPKNLIAGMFGFTPRLPFAADAAAATAPTVKLNQ